MFAHSVPASWVQAAAPLQQGASPARTSLGLTPKRARKARLKWAWLANPYSCAIR